MPRHFIYPNGAYFETSEDVPLSNYPEGTIVVPPRPSPDHDWQGGTWVHVAPPPVVPQSISILQAELAAGPALVQQIETFMALPDTPWAMKRAYAKANVLERNSQMVDELAWVLGWSPAQIDALFIAGAQISV